MASVHGRYRNQTSRVLLLCATFLVLIYEGDCRRCYWCGPLADQVHRSRRAPPCLSHGNQMAACEPGRDHCAVVATAPPYVESRICVKLYQDECYPLFCNTSRSWKMVCPCRGDLCNGANGARENEAFVYLVKLASRTQNYRLNKRETTEEQENTDEQTIAYYKDVTNDSTDANPELNAPTITSLTIAAVSEYETTNTVYVQQADEPFKSETTSNVNNQLPTPETEMDFSETADITENIESSTEIPNKKVSSNHRESKIAGNSAVVMEITLEMADEPRTTAQTVMMEETNLPTAEARQEDDTIKPHVTSKIINTTIEHTTIIQNKTETDTSESTTTKGQTTKTPSKNDASSFSSYMTMIIITSTCIINVFS